VAVAGNIGVGKSTLVRLLCQRLDWEPFYEPVAENPYLTDFYKNMPAWGFHSQIFFLTHRLQIHQQLLRFSGSVIQDRSIYEDAEVFAQNLSLQGALSARDFETYWTLYRTLTQFFARPRSVNLSARLSSHIDETHCPARPRL
jgi:Deoxynucleoside kinases